MGCPWSKYEPQREKSTSEEEELQGNSPKETNDQSQRKKEKKTKKAKQTKKNKKAKEEVTKDGPTQSNEAGQIKTDQEETEQSNKRENADRSNQAVRKPRDSVYKGSCGNLKCIRGRNNTGAEVSAPAKQNAPDATEQMESQTNGGRGTTTENTNKEAQGQPDMCKEDNLNKGPVQEQRESSKVQNKNGGNNMSKTDVQSHPDKQNAHETHDLSKTQNTEKKQSAHETADLAKAQTGNRKSANIQKKMETESLAKEQTTESRQAAAIENMKQSGHETNDIAKANTTERRQAALQEKTQKEHEEEQLQRQNEELEAEIKETTVRLEKTMKGNKGKVEDDIAKEVAKLKKEVTKLETETNYMHQDIQNKIKEIENLEAAKNTELDLLKRDKEDLVKSKDLALAKKSEKIENLEKEKEELLLRLSAMAGRRLTDNNPDIADLSDMNRPTKLAEKYSELYDNDWTDAFSYLQNSDQYKESEMEVISALLTMLVTAYRVSLKAAAGQLGALYKILNDFRANTDTDQHVKDIMKQLKDYRKRVIQPNKKLAQEYRREIEEAFPRLPASSFDSGALKNYLEKCLELCWLMVIQDPPVHLHCDGCKRGSKFDKNEYKEYTQAGPVVAFTVWPAVFLEKDGALLCKGVVQCDKRLSCSVRIPNTPDKETVWKSGSLKMRGETTSPKSSESFVKKAVAKTMISTEKQDSEGSTIQTAFEYKF